MKPTKLLFLDNMFLYNANALVLDLIKNEETAIILDQTIFYPQGGGQPTDKGTIQDELGNIFKVELVKKNNNIVYHYGKFENQEISKASKVSLHIDKNLRMLHSRLHTAGHLIDYALSKAGYKFESTKAYHFPLGAYVEYKGMLDEESRQKLLPLVEQIVNDIVKSNLAVSIFYKNKNELKNINIPENVEENLIRIMNIKDYELIPCGGTHVFNTNQIGKILIRKIKNEKGNLRISYAIE